MTQVRIEPITIHLHSLAVPTACYDLYTITIPWNLAYVSGASNQYNVACGLGKDTTNPLTTYYNGTIIVSYLEQIQIVDQYRPLNMTRGLSKSLNFQAGLPTQTSAVITPISNSDLRLIRSVINQTYTPIGEHLTLMMYTSIQYPYVILTAFHTALPPEVDSAENLVVCGTNNKNSFECIWNITLTLFGGNCVFDGYYIYNFTIDCAANGFIFN